MEPFSAPYHVPPAFLPPHAQTHADQDPWRRDTRAALAAKARGACWAGTAGIGPQRAPIGTP